MFYDFLEMDGSIDILSKLNPDRDISMHGWVHRTVVQQYFAEFHKLVNLNGLIVVVIKFKTDLSDVLHILNFIHIEVKEKLDKSVKSKILFILGQSHKGENERMLLFDLVNDDVFASCFSKFVVEDSCWNLYEEKHVEKDEDYEINVVWLMILEGKHLIVRVVIVG